ncbi:MAG: hypothetical protein WBG71_15670 [Leeuwenhoekiella sp.]
MFNEAVSVKGYHPVFLLALIFGLVLHGVGMFFTLESSYDALIHLFFADHYLENWFEPWNYSWYTGFTVHGYPPLVHQAIAVFAAIGGLKFGMFTVALIAIFLFITGVYRFSLLLSSNAAVAGYTALIAVMSSTFAETFHLFGQLPSVMGLAVLLHSMPEVYNWLRTGKKRFLASSLSLIAVTVSAHHVTPIFGMVFFIFPLIGFAIMDAAKETEGTFKKITFFVFFAHFKKMFWRIAFFGGGSLVLFIGCIFPYWVNSKTNPITQVPIPHGSRDNFLEVTSSGLMFFVIPWGIMMFVVPYIFYRFFSKRFLFYGISFTILSVLGTGGTTPIPRAVLGENAFNILTLDRFTLWAVIVALPIFGEFLYRFWEGDLKETIANLAGKFQYRAFRVLLVLGVVFMAIFTMALGKFRPAQPTPIKMLPIINFLNQDQHDKWRFLPLGFGDQMAWLSAQTNAATIDGNYHSARRLPELTTRAIERLENSKFRGVEGLGSLQQFLTVPEKYNLKYVFSNDKFYDPLLFFAGWQRLTLLENGIMVWERQYVPPLPSVLSRDEVSEVLCILWGVLPLFTVFMALATALITKVVMNSSRFAVHPEGVNYGTPFKKPLRTVLRINYLWFFVLIGFIGYGMYVFYIENKTQLSPKNVLTAYYDALDFKEFERAHSYLNPEMNKSITQFMLEVSITDGILSSYAKLDSIGVQLLNSSKAEARAKVYSRWITPLEAIETIDFHHLVKHQGKWYIDPTDTDEDLSPDQLFTSNTTVFYNHGRRTISSEKTYHEDILKQPELQVIDARMVKKDGYYSVIGQLQNIDVVPADIAVAANLYNSKNQILATYNAKYLIKHKLMPKEVTSFKIDFEGTSWTSPGEEFPTTFDPDEFKAKDLTELPIKFDIQCTSNVANSDLYKQVAAQDLVAAGDQLSGTLMNTGVQEVTIPQLIFSYYDEDKNLIWLDHQFVGQAIRVQHRQFFDHQTANLLSLKEIPNALTNVGVNGLPNKSRSTGDTNTIKSEGLIPCSGDGFSYIKVEMNNYVGNPH